MTTEARPQVSGLRSECLSFSEILAQSVANIAPSAAPTLNVPLMFAAAGTGTWLVFLIATIGLGLVCLNINQFARRSASPGSLYSYIARGFGPTIGILSGWALLLAYLFTAMALMGGLANYTNVLLAAFGTQAHPIFLYAIGISIAAYVAYRDIQLSTLFMLVLELFSIGLILALAGVILFQHGFALDTAQLTLAGTSPEGLRQGLVLAVLSYVGYESATALGDEAKKPLKLIPRAVLLSTLLAGLFFIFLSYVEVLGFSGYATPLDKSDAPLSVLAELAGIKFFGTLISMAAIISMFGGSLASIHASSRVMFALARHGLFHTVVGQAHSRHKTPHIAVVLSALVVFLVAAALSLFNIRGLDAFGYLGSLATYGFLMVYILVSMAAPIYLHRLGKLRSVHILISASATMFMLIPIVGSLYPAPPAPYNAFPYLFLLLLGIGGGWILWLRLRSPGLIKAIEQDLEAIHDRFNHLKKV